MGFNSGFKGLNCVVSLGKWLSSFRKVAVFLASGQSNVGFLDPEGKGHTILLILGKYLPMDREWNFVDLNLLPHPSEHLTSLENSHAIINRITVPNRPFTNIYCLSS